MHFIVQRFFRSRNCEQGECGSIENNERLGGKTLQYRMLEENDGGADECDGWIAPIAERLRRHGAD
jgi:hypothetical protein